MIFSSIKGITIPEGVVKQIAEPSGKILWKLSVANVDVSALAINYTGAYTDEADVVMSGKTYRLLTLTGSGTLTLPQQVTADVWMCNGGNSGLGQGSNGGGGGYFLQNENVSLETSTVCVIGSGGKGTSTTSGKAGGTTTFGSLAPEAQPTTGTRCGMGASGGGLGGLGSYSGYCTGKGVTTVPFGEYLVFDEHSAGGGGGCYRDLENSDTWSGADGGSDGENGSKDSVEGSTAVGAGGTKGGGDGGKGATSGSTGGSATFYGSGGGGGGFYVSKTGSTKNGTSGAGYQGVIYVRIPYEQ